MKYQYVILLFTVFLFFMTACQKREYYQDIQPTQTVTMQTMAVTVPITQPAGQPTEQPTQALPEPADTDFVKITDYIPTASQELFYATENNFTGQRIYDFEDAYLRYGTVKKLQKVSEDLAQMGIYLKIWDGFRPVSAQFRLWEILPDPTYVANPNVGYSSHSRGNTIDLTIVDANGVEFEMPTGFDDFTTKADRNYSDCTEAAANNAQLLEVLMEKHGFKGYYGEWWHYSDTDSYPVENHFEP